MTSTAIAIFGYRRSAHLAQTLTSLQNQKPRVALPIYLFFDGPRSEHDREPVEACHQVAQSFAQQLAITIYPSMHNRGLYDSLTSGVSMVLREHEQVIVMEDDIVVSPFFLEYLLAALSCYRGDASVASIHGYLPPIPIRLPETFFLRGADCWGWATWRDRWALYRHDAASMAKEIRHRHLARAFNLGGGVPNLALLDARAAGQSNSWAICWHASCFLAGCYTLHPGRSLVQNIGLDHPGEHCRSSPSLETRCTDQPILVSPQPVRERADVVAAFARQIAPAPLPRRVFHRLLSLARQVPQTSFPSRRGSR